MGQGDLHEQPALSLSLYPLLPVTRWLQLCMILFGVLFKLSDIPKSPPTLDAPPRPPASMSLIL